MKMAISCMIVCFIGMNYAAPGVKKPALMKSLSGRILPIINYGFPNKQKPSQAFCMKKKGSMEQILRPSRELEEKQKKSLRARIMQIIENN